MPNVHQEHAARLRRAQQAVHPSPTDGQREAENYRQGHLYIHGLDITIEVAAGQDRVKTRPDGTKWTRRMHNAYGRILGTKGGDGEHLDVYMGDQPSSEVVYVIDQTKADGSFDEQKVCIGFIHKEDAKKAYLRHYPAGWDRLGKITTMTMPDFKRWAFSEDAKRPAAAQSFKKLAGLLPETELQPHQQHLKEEAAKPEPFRKLLFHGLGSGKGLSALTAAETKGEPYTAIVPASLRENIKKEINRWTDKKTPSSVMSLSGLAAGKPIENPNTLIFDEAARLRNASSKQTIQAQEAADHAKNLILLSGTPITNRPGDLAPLVSMLTGKRMDPDSFERQFVGHKTVRPGFLNYLRGARSFEEPAVNHPEELKALLRGSVDYYSPEKPPVDVQHTDVPVEMSTQQARLYHAMWNELPWLLRWRLQQNYPLSDAELHRATSFLAGPRQVGLSTLPYRRDKDPLKAYGDSAKLQKAMELLKGTLADPRKKVVAYSNFIDAGLRPYAAALAKEKIPHAIFHGGLNDAERKQLVEDYNTNKLRVALLGPSAAEGISLRGTSTLQMLDSAWNQARNRQAQGRGIRFDSHQHLPEELRNVQIQRFIARLPLGLKDKLMATVGFDRKPQTYAADDYLQQIAERKDLINKKFMQLLQEVGTEGKHASTLVWEDDSAISFKMGSTLDTLRLAKHHSDLGEYRKKHEILGAMITRRPHEWMIDDDKGGHVVGITHKPTGWRYHLPRGVVPATMFGHKAAEALLLFD